MIKEPILIMLYNSYDIVEWEKAVMLKCIEDNPSFAMEDLAERLKVSKRNLYRKFKKHGIKLKELKPKNEHELDAVFR